MAGPENDGGDGGSRLNKTALIAGAIMLLIVGGAIFGAISFVNSERQREIQGWQIRLGIVADSRIAAINEWVDKNFSDIRDLAQNASLQVYMSELTNNEDSAKPGKKESLESALEPSTDSVESTDSEIKAEEEIAGDGASASYLLNLLIATAERTGFKAPPPVGEVNANIERVGVAGLGLVDKDGRPIVSTPDMPPLSGKVRAAVAKALDGEPAVIDMFIGASGQPTMGFVLPIYGIQDDASAGAKGIGAVVGLRIVGRDLYDRLKQPGETAKSAASYIVRAKGATIEFLTPLADDSPALTRSLSADTPDLVAALAIKRPGGFIIGRDYSGVDVLAASRPVANLSWVLIRKISRQESLADADARLGVILGVFVTIIVIVTLAILFVWKKGASVRATQALHDAQLALERFSNISKFMNVVTNNQPNIIVAVDGDTQYTFANEPAAIEAGIPVADMMGKTMASVIGPIKAQTFADINKSVLVKLEKEAHTVHFGDPEIEDPDDDERFQVVRSYHVPLSGDRDFPPAVLMILSDITELTFEKRRGERMMNQLIDTLITVVDRRDPFSANHSTRVAEVSKAIAHEMDMSEVEMKTVETAGKLMNLGKIFISPEVLTKTDDLTPEERSLIGNAYLTTVDLIEGVTFEGPVVETIRQFGETWDGRGPLGLKAEEIIVTARILAVANAFVGMVSTRAYRSAMPFEKSADILTNEAGTKMDRKAVTALCHYLENRGGMRRWAHFRDKPQQADSADA